MVMVTNEISETLNRMEKAKMVKIEGDRVTLTPDAMETTSLVFGIGCFLHDYSTYSLFSKTFKGKIDTLYREIFSLPTKKRDVYLEIVDEAFQDFLGIRDFILEYVKEKHGV